MLCEVSRLRSQPNNQQTKGIKVDKVVARMLPTETNITSTETSHAVPKGFFIDCDLHLKYKTLTRFYFQLYRPFAISDF